MRDAIKSQLYSASCAGVEGNVEAELPVHLKAPPCTLLSPPVKKPVIFLTASPCASPTPGDASVRPAEILPGLQIHKTLCECQRA